MLQAVIDFSLRNKFIVLLATIALALAGIFALRNIPLDAIPDLSDTQVIIYTEWPGQAPQIVQDQVTYPITTKMLSVPHAKVVRGLFVLRLLVCLCHLRRRHRSLLGAEPRSGIPKFPRRQSAEECDPCARARRHRCRMGVHVFT